MTKPEQRRVFKWILNNSHIVPGYVYMPVFNLFYPEGRYRIGLKQVSKDDYNKVKELWEGGTTRSEAAQYASGILKVKFHRAWGLLEKTFGE